MKNFRLEHTKFAFLVDLTLEYYRKFIPNKIKNITTRSESYLRKVLYNLRQAGYASYKRIIVVDWKKLGINYCYFVITLNGFKSKDYNEVIKFLNDNREFIEVREHMDGDIILIAKATYKNDGRKTFLARMLSEMREVKSIHTLDVIDYHLKAPFPLSN